MVLSKKAKFPCHLASHHKNKSSLTFVIDNNITMLIIKTSIMIVLNESHTLRQSNYLQQQQVSFCSSDPWKVSVLPVLPLWHLCNILTGVTTLLNCPSATRRSLGGTETRSCKWGNYKTSGNSPVVSKSLPLILHHSCLYPVPEWNKVQKSLFSLSLLKVKSCWRKFGDASI